MPTNGTKVLTVRVRSEIAEAIQTEAEARGLTRNRVLELELESRFSRGDVARKMHLSDQISDEHQAVVLPE